MEQVHMELGNVLQVFHLGKHPLPDQVTENIELPLGHFGPFLLDLGPFRCGNGLGGQKIDELGMQFLQLFLGQATVFHSVLLEVQAFGPLCAQMKKGPCSHGPLILKNFYDRGYFASATTSKGKSKTTALCNRMVASYGPSLLMAPPLILMNFR